MPKRKKVASPSSLKKQNCKKEKYGFPLVLRIFLQVLRLHRMCFTKKCTLHSGTDRDITRNEKIAGHLLDKSNFYSEMLEDSMEKHPKEKCLCDFNPWPSDLPLHYEGRRRRRSSPKSYWYGYGYEQASETQQSFIFYEKEWTICKNDNIDFSHRSKINNRYRWKLLQSTPHRRRIDLEYLKLRKECYAPPGDDEEDLKVCSSIWVPFGKKEKKMNRKECKRKYHFLKNRCRAFEIAARKKNIFLSFLL